MQRFFVGAGDMQNGHVTICNADARHLAASLRAQAGERIVVVEEAQKEHGVVITQVSSDAVTGNIEWTQPATGEPHCHVHLLQAIPKDGIDEVVDAVTQLGVTDIWPIITERTVVRVPVGRRDARVARWNTIARHAAQLSQRALVPTVHPIVNLMEALTFLPDGTRVLTCTFSADAVALAHISMNNKSPIAICVGPEGSLTLSEVQEMKSLGAIEVHLGPRVLRSRLAGIIAVSLVLANASAFDTPLATNPWNASNE